MNVHVVNVLAAFAVAYVSSVVYWLAAHGSKFWRILSATFVIVGFLSLAALIVQSGTGVETGWDWWILLGWTFGWIAWFFTKQELDLE